jgi:hypothetical protein
MAHKPGGLESHVKGSMKLVGTNAFLGSRHKINGLKPKAHRDMRIFKDSSHFDSERLAADIALIGAYAGTCPLKFTNAVFAPAFGTNRTIGPDS